MPRFESSGYRQILDSFEFTILANLLLKTCCTNIETRLIMNCPNCSTQNDADAGYCSECGKLLALKPEIETGKARKPYRFIFFLIPVIFIAAGFGYYKYYLPDGVSALVNGQEIKRSELDAAVARVQAVYGTSSEGDQAGPQARKLRYQVLNGLISERLILHEADKAGFGVSPEEVAAAASLAQKASGMDQHLFSAEVIRRYGSLQAFEEAVRRDLIVEKFISEKVLPKGVDDRTARAEVDRWVEKLRASSAVRVTLSEQWSGAGCGCCGKSRGTPAAEQGGKQQGSVLAGVPQSADGQKAADAGLKYWREKHGEEDVSARVSDFGCHLQVDIVKKGQTIGSLRYQGGNLSEMR